MLSPPKFLAPVPNSKGRPSSFFIFPDLNTDAPSVTPHPAVMAQTPGVMVTAGPEVDHGHISVSYSREVVGTDASATGTVEA